MGQRSTWQAPPKAPRVTRIDNVAASTDGRVIALYDDGIVLLETQTGKEITKFACKGGSQAIAFSPDHQFIVSAGSDNLIKVWETATGRLMQSLKAENMTPASLALSVDGRYLAVGGHNGSEN